MKEGTIEDELEKLAQIVKTKQGRLRNLSEVTNYTIDDYIEIPKGRYIVSKDITIKEKGTLEIEPGTELYFKSKGGVISHGTLKAIGTEEENIIFTAAGHNWKNIVFEGNLSSESTLEYCLISRGSGREIEDHSDIRTGGGVKIIGSDPTIKNCIIENNHGYDGGGIYFYNSNSILEENTIRKNRAKSEGGGLYFGESSPILKNNNITNNKAKDGGGVYFWWCSNVTLENNTIKNNKPDNISATDKKWKKKR